jgi:hypothetical protein
MSLLSFSDDMILNSFNDWQSFMSTKYIDKDHYVRLGNLERRMLYKLSRVKLYSLKITYGRMPYELQGYPVYPYENFTQSNIIWVQSRHEWVDVVRQWMNEDHIRRHADHLYYEIQSGIVIPNPRNETGDEIYCGSMVDDIEIEGNRAFVEEALLVVADTTHHVKLTWDQHEGSKFTRLLSDRSGLLNSHIT